MKIAAIIGAVVLLINLAAWGTNPAQMQASMGCLMGAGR